MLMRCTAVALLTMTAACMTEADDSVDELPLREPAAEADAPALDVLADRLPPDVPTWTNHRPQPGTDDIATSEDSDVKVRIDDLLANDVDPDGGRVVFMGLGTSRGGTISLSGRDVTFTPDPDFTGVAYFDYVISDGRLQATGPVKVHVAPINDPPIAYGELVNTRTDEPIMFRLDAIDPDGDALVVDILEAPMHGALSGDGDKYVYAPASAWSGTDRLVYRVGDASTWSDPVTVDLVVAPR
jgi:hypothetical protein